MKKHIIILCLLLSPFNFFAEESTQTAIELKHSNIYIKKITNASGRSAFISLERIFVTPLNDTIDSSGHLMSGKDFQLNDADHTPYAFAVPIWQKTFRGNTFNVITLSGNPGRIYFLYSINGHLWAIKAPHQEGDLKGVHLLDPADHDRAVELTIKDNNVLVATVLEEQPNSEQQNSKPRQNPVTADPQQEKGSSRRHVLPTSAQKMLGGTAPE